MPIFKTIRAKILFLVVLLMSITTISVLLITKRNFDIEYQKVHAELIRQVQRFGMQALENEHREFMQKKVQTVMRWRELQQHMTRSVHAVLEQHYDLYEDGILTKQEAQRRSLDWILNFRYGGTRYFFVYDNTLTGLAHPLPEMLGKHWKGIQDVKLQDTFLAMRRAVQEKDVEHGVFFWPRLPDGRSVKQLGYFSYYAKWDWVIGTSVEIEELEQDTQEMMTAILDKFTNIFLSERFVESGYLFVVNGAGKMLIHPTLGGRVISGMRDGKSGEFLLERLQKAVNNDQQLVEFSFHGSREKEHLELASVRYFKAFDWYVAASVYKESILAPAERLALRQSFIIFSIFLLGVCIATIISRKISRHISLFADYAKQLPERNLAGENALPDFPTRSHRLDDEVGQLEHAFIFMETQLRKKMQEVRAYQENLEERVQRRTRQLSESNSRLQGEIIERIKIEKELSRVQHLLSNIINSMPSVLVGIDKQGCVTQWNREAEKLTLIPAFRAQGKELFELLPQLLGEREKVQATIQSRQPQTHEKVPLKLGDRNGFADIIVYPLIAESGEGAVIRIDDVTERVRLEEVMIQSEKMMSVGGLAAGMAHEINNPLGIILQSVQNFLRRLSPDIEKNLEVAEECGIALDDVRCYLEKRRALRHLEAVQAAGLRAAKIVGNMLNFSRRSEADKIPTDINRLLEESLELAANDYDLRNRYNFRQIAIFREYDTSLPLVPCIVMEIEQVLLNLLKNAAQALAEVRDEGHQAQIRIRTRGEREHVFIDVTDNGIGMSQKMRKQIFDPFFTTKPVGQGTGLGLSVSYFIIKNHHQGMLSVDSQSGRGARFTLCLPLSA